MTDRLGLDDVPYVVTALELLTSTIAEVWLSPEAERIEYLPGQYVLLEDTEHRLVPRSYSIANTPRPDGALSMLITRVPAGQISTWVHDRLAVGARVSLSGPYGNFRLGPHMVRTAAVPGSRFRTRADTQPCRSGARDRLEAPGDGRLLGPHGSGRARPRALR